MPFILYSFYRIFIDRVFVPMPMSMPIPFNSEVHDFDRVFKAMAKELEQGTVSSMFSSLAKVLELQSSELQAYSDKYEIDMQNVADEYALYSATIRVGHDTSQWFP